MTGAVDAPVTDDPLDGAWHPTGWWTTTNLGEALPGVLTPLTWSFSGPGLEASVRRAFAEIGALAAADRHRPADTREWCIGVFGGRVAVNVDFLGAMADRLPGTSGAAFAEQFFGELPEGFTSASTRRRYPVIAARLPYAFLTTPGRVRSALRETSAWWEDAVDRTPTLSLDEARMLFDEARRSYEDLFTLHNVTQMVGVQPLYEQVQKLAAQAGVEHLVDALVAGGASHAEVEVVEGLWSLSRDEITLEQFLREHGCHGPGEGELATRSWREDPTPVHAICAQYRERAESDAPSEGHRRGAARRAQATRAVLANLPARRRVAARMVLDLAAARIPLRGVGKAAALRSIDVGRAAARRAGEHLVAAGSLTSADDVFLLTAEELRTVRPGTPLTELVQQRRARREAHLGTRLPVSWRGRPDVRDAADVQDDGAAVTLSGFGASSGTVEGRVRVLHDPAFEEVEAGDILVAPFTDPGWASVMFVASALVVDIGGMQSHAAVIARELGIPCVMGTGDGTRRLRTGDTVRVDGRAGTVELLQRAESLAPAGEDGERTSPVEAAGSVAETDVPVSVDAPTETAVLQVLRLKGRADAAAVAAATGMGPEEVSSVLDALASAGKCEAVGPRHRPTEQGRARLEECLAAERGQVDLPALERLYVDFTELNAQFKELAAAWQQRDGEPNDHTDAHYDQQILDRLAAIHERLLPLLEALAGVAPRLGAYPARFVAALDRIREGDHAWFLRPVIDSYHTIWFELHEDLIGLSGRTREAEALAGRAE